MEFSASQLSLILGGAIEGNPNVSVHKLSKIEEGVPGSLTFLANPVYTHYIYTTAASIVIVNQDFVPTQSVAATMIRVASAANAFAKLLEMYNEIKLKKTGISPLAYISPKASVGTNIYAGEFAVISDGAKIGNNVKIYPQVFIGENVTIGDNTTLFAGVKVYSDCQIGKDCILHSGTVIGSDGFRFAPENEEGQRKVPQIGNVLIEDDVEIGANTTIDRATMGSTVIKKGVKLDNLIQIAHNAEVGEHTVIAAQTGVSGSTKVGSHCLIGGQVGMVGHISIANGTKINAQSGISKSVTTPYTVLNSSPAFDYKSSLKSQAVFRHLPEMQARLNKLEETVQELLSLLSTQKNVS